MEPLKPLKPLTNLVSGKPMGTLPVEFAPGQFGVGEINAADIPRYGLVRLMRQTDGSYVPILRLYGQYRRITGLADELGIVGLSQKTLERLVYGGFVQGLRPSPQVVLVDMESLAQHLEATRDPEFWTPLRRAQWSETFKPYGDR